MGKHVWKEREAKKQRKQKIERERENNYLKKSQRRKSNDKIIVQNTPPPPRLWVYPQKVNIWLKRFHIVFCPQRQSEAQRNVSRYWGTDIIVSMALRMSSDDRWMRSEHDSIYTKRFVSYDCISDTKTTPKARFPRLSQQSLRGSKL